MKLHSMQHRWGVSWSHELCPFFFLKLVVLRNNQWLIQAATLEALCQISLRTLQRLGRCCTNILKCAVVFWDKRRGFDVCENTLKQMPRVSFKSAWVKVWPSCFTLLEGAMFSSAAPSLSVVCARPGRESGGGGGEAVWASVIFMPTAPFLTTTCNSKISSPCLSELSENCYKMKSGTWEQVLLSTKLVCTDESSHVTQV